MTQAGPLRQARKPHLNLKSFPGFLWVRDAQLLVRRSVGVPESSPILAAQYIPPETHRDRPTNAHLEPHSMPPKGKKGQTADKARAGEEEREDPLQAVVRAICAHPRTWRKYMLTY